MDFAVVRLETGRVGVGEEHGRARQDRRCQTTVPGHETTERVMAPSASLRTATAAE